MRIDSAATMQILSRFRDSDATVMEMDTPSGMLRLRKHPAPGIALQAELVVSGVPEVTVTGYEPSDHPGPGYPADMPFVPGLQVSVMPGPDPSRPTLAWWGVPDASEVATELVRQLERDGWEPAGEEALPPPISVRHITLRRGFEERIILASGAPSAGMVQLLSPRSGGVT